MKMKVLLAVMATLTMTFGLVSRAGALDTTQLPTFAQVIGPVVIDRHDPTVGYLTAIYRCTGERALWVSVKQVESRSPDPALRDEGSSGISAAWSMSHRNSVTCDGHLHFQRFTVDQVETQAFGIPLSPLKFGWGYVQFCLFDDNFPQTADGMPYINDGFHFVL